MSERIYKLQPNRTMQLRGFDAFGAAAAMHNATANSFTVSGVFRDAADFAVLVLYDADNFYEHSRLKHLPDFDFNGLTLSFNVHYNNLRPLESPRYATIDWPYLDVVKSDNSTARIRLSDHATLASGSNTKASGQFTIADAGLKQYDRVTLWYQNYAFDVTVPQIECAYAFSGAGAGTQHRISVNGTDYIYTETATDTTTSLTAALAALVDASPYVSATVGPAWQINLRAKDNSWTTLNITSTGGSPFTLYAVGPNAIAANLATQINAVDWVGPQIALPLEATAAANVLTVRCSKPCVDGNAITMYSVASSSRLTATTTQTAFGTNKWHLPFTGGSSDCTWTVTLDFAALGVPSIRTMWLTFAPPLNDAALLPDTEWTATFTNWTLTGPENKRRLPVAGVDSVRIEEDSSWCKYTGTWAQQTGFYSGAYCRSANVAGAKVSVFYSCSQTHDLYVGTTLFADRGQIGVRLDGDTETVHNFAVSADAPIYARRLLRTNVPAGQHTVTLTLQNNATFDFDFLEAAVPTDVPAPLPTRSNISPAFDYSTDHTFKLPPARLHWILDQLGFAGSINEYIGVFWWNQRKRVDAVVPTATITFGGTYQAGDQVILYIGGTPVGKSVFPNEDASVIARHFAWFINSNLVGIYASVSGSVLTLTNRSPMGAYAFSLSIDNTSAAGTASIAGALTGGQPGKWVIDLDQDPPINRAARDWHANFYSEGAAREREMITACSMELVNPPSGFAAVYADGQPVVTDVGFASLKSTHCTFNTAMLNFQKRVYANIADLQATAGLTPYIQFGEFLWWFFTNQTTTNPSGGMAFYDAETQSAALTALGRALHVFRKPTDNPNVNSYADADFLRARLRDHIAALRAHVLAVHSDAKFELLYPYDVNYPVPAGVHQIGGALNNYINLPAEFKVKPGSGLDSMKIEALDFGAWSRNLDLSAAAIQLPIDLGWPRNSLRYLVPIFRGGAAWEKEYQEAVGRGIPTINLWAFDHINLYNLNCREPRKSSQAFISS